MSGQERDEGEEYRKGEEGGGGEEREREGRTEERFGE